jgi:hypothetical protein
MLRIEVPSDGLSGLTFNELEKYEIPAPPHGFNSEINNSVVMPFEDEQQAIDYAHELDAYSDSIDQESRQYLIRWICTGIYSKLISRSGFYNYPCKCQSTAKA